MNKKYYKAGMIQLGCVFKSIGSNADMEKENEYEGDYLYSTENNHFLLRVRDNGWCLFKGILYDTVIDDGTSMLLIKDFLPLILKHNN